MRTTDILINLQKEGGTQHNDQGEKSDGKCDQTCFKKQERTQQQ